MLTEAYKKQAMQKVKHARPEHVAKVLSDWLKTDCCGKESNKKERIQESQKNVLYSRRCNEIKGLLEKI